MDDQTRRIQKFFLDKRPKPDIDLFAGADNPELWKGKRYWVCQSSMSLWIALSPEHTHAICEQRHMTREEESAAARSYPLDTNGCRCKWCRYCRMCRKGKSWKAKITKALKTTVTKKAKPNTTN